MYEHLLWHISFVYSEEYAIIGGVQLYVYIDVDKRIIYSVSKSFSRNKVNHLTGGIALS